MACAPEHLLHLAAAGRTWFRCADAPTVGAMHLAASQTSLPEGAIGTLPERRARAVRTIYAWVRDTSFARRVLRAYNHRCAVTGLQLDLPVAAHVLPVASGEKNDEVSNGIALSPTFHSALDDALVYPAYDVHGRLHLKRNGMRSGYLRHRGWDGEAALVLAYADRVIPEGNLPADRADWPDPEMVRRGNVWRGIRKA